MRFFTNSGGGNTATVERMRITSDGDIHFPKNNGTVLLSATDNFGNIALGAGDGGSGTIIEPHLFIKWGGNVGIGEDNPTEILHTNKDSAGDVVGGYFTNSNANTGAEKVSLAFGLNRSGGDFVRQTKAITFGAEQQWTGTPSTVDGYLAFSTMQMKLLVKK